MWFVFFFLVLLSTIAKAEGEEDKPSAAVYTDVLSQYIWRGFALSRESAVIQPSLAASYKGFSISVWGNYDTNDHNPAIPNQGAKWNETDLILSYSREIYGGLSATVGTIYYSLNGPDSTEVYGGLSYALPWLTVAVTGYREVSHYPGWWVQFDLSRNIKLPCYDMSVDLGMTFVYLNSSDNTAYPDPDNPDQAFSGFLSGQIFAALNIPVWKFISISPRIGFAFPLSHQANQELTLLSWDQQANHVFGGIRIAASF
ncbi:MAG TPA: hypothetical protein PKV86_00695 [Syntrophobacteraceae bacterium]|nr:hypothetical protein [Syntrophobacteraceae bacterium]